MTILVTGAIQYSAIFCGTGTASGMPDGATLQVHLLTVTEGVATFGATRTSRMKMVILASLEKN